MQSLQQRCSSPRLALQAPVPTHGVDELVLLGHLEFARVFDHAVEDVRGDEGRAGGVALLVRPRGLVRRLLDDELGAPRLGALQDDAGSPTTLVGALGRDLERHRTFGWDEPLRRGGKGYWWSAPELGREPQVEGAISHLRVLLAVRLELVPSLAACLHLDLETTVASAGDVKGSEAASGGALDAGPDAFLAEVADLEDNV